MAKTTINTATSPTTDKPAPTPTPNSTVLNARSTVYSRRRRVGYARKGRNHVKKTEIQCRQCEALVDIRKLDLHIRYC